MQTTRTHEQFADFQRPKTILEPITVNRILPDSSKEWIGYISTDFLNGDCPPIYLSFNTQGEELFPATEHYTEAEAMFERYAKRLSNESLQKINYIQTTQKEEEIKNIRAGKGRTEKSIAITQ
jgi:hypothetical protein